MYSPPPTGDSGLMHLLKPNAVLTFYQKNINNGKAGIKGLKPSLLLISLIAPGGSETCTRVNCSTQKNWPTMVKQWELQCF